MPPPPARPLRVAGMYSDLLHKPHWLASCALDAAWLARDTLPRAAGLSAAKFYADFEEPNVPVVITDVVRARSALHGYQPCCEGSIAHNSPVPSKAGARHAAAGGWAERGAGSRVILRNSTSWS